MFDQAKADLTSANETYVEVGRKAIKATLVEFMTTHPEVSALRWRGGVPSFNDGDPCVYQMYEPEVRLREPGEPSAPVASEIKVVNRDDEFDESDEPDDDSDDDSSEDGEGDFLDTYDLPETEEGKRLRKDIQSLYEVLQLAEDAIIDLFGDGHEVTVLPDGRAIVEDYSE